MRYNFNVRQYFDYFDLRSKTPMNQKTLTMSFVATPQLKAWLEKQAAEDDRSVSYILRKIIEREFVQESASRRRLHLKEEQ